LSGRAAADALSNTPASASTSGEPSTPNSAHGEGTPSSSKLAQQGSWRSGAKPKRRGFSRFALPDPCNATMFRVGLLTRSLHFVWLVAPDPASSPESAGDGGATSGSPVNADAAARTNSSLDQFFMSDIVAARALHAQERAASGRRDSGSDEENS